MSQSLRGSAALVIIAHADGLEDGTGHGENRQVNVSMEEQARLG